MRIRRLLPFFLSPLLLLGGCAGLLPGAPPAASRNAAVTALFETAQTQAADGQLETAGAALERALRIEPRNPVLWQELARVRLAQGHFRQAENLAAKSNALAGETKCLRPGNWRIIGQARSGLGDPRGAQAAFERADRER